MTINVRIRDGMCPDPTTGEGGATEGDIRGSFSDIIDVVGVKDLVGGHCAVTENSPAALSVLVAPGIVYVPNADYDELDSNEPKFYEAIIDAEGEVAIAENTSGSTRIDLICVKVDKTITPDEHASNIATLVAVAGTPGAGAPTLPDNYAKLAEVEVANGASTIVTADITDSRVQSRIKDSYLPAVFTGKTFDDEFRVKQIATPANPSSGYNKLYFKSDDKLYKKTSAGVETEIGASGTGVDGWTSANETWTYASANTITVPSGAAAKYAIGDRIRWKQGAGYKYGVIITVADTLLTIAINTDYTVATPTAITDNYYSHQASPIGYPQWFNYSPTWTAVDPMTFTSSDHRVSRFSITGKTCTVEFAEGGTTGGSAGPSITMTLPVASTSSSADYFATGVMCYEGTYETGTCINSNATVVRFQKYAGGNWGLGTARYIIGNLTYKIA